MLKVTGWSILLWYALLAVLETFKNTYPNIDYKWDINNPSEYDKQIINDGFIEAKVSLNKIPNLFASFSSKEDLILSRTNTKSDGEIYDYLEFYNDEILKKTEVNINDLNPLYREIIGKSLNLGKTRTLKK